ncbi:hypothetical protein OSTOST_01929 [Ostertagia ostertagi]
MLSPPQLMVVQALTVNKNTKSKQAITVLLDSGSQHSYIRRETAANLGLKLENPQNITALTFGGHPHTQKSYRAKIILHNKKSGQRNSTYGRVSSRASPPKEAQEGFRSTINKSLDTYKSFIPFTRTNSRKKLVRIASYVLKYVAIHWRRTKKSSSSKDTSFRILHLMSETQTITASNMKAEEILLLREHNPKEVIELQGHVVQRLRISLGEDGIYRGDLRMANAEIADSAKTPILLLPKHQLTRSADGSVRSVKIKTGNNKFLDRSVNQPIPLEVCASDVQNVLQPKKQSQPTRIQPERKAKQR